MSYVRDRKPGHYNWIMLCRKLAAIIFGICKTWTGPFLDHFWDHFLDHFLDYFLDYFLDHFLDYFLDRFLDHFIGGKHTISNQGGVGCSLLVLREGWEAECYYSGRGERRTIARQ